MTRYMKAAIANDWLAMERGKSSLVATHALNDLYSEILSYIPPDSRGTAIFAEILHQLDLMTPGGQGLS